MSETPDTTVEALNKELETLRTKNRELLAEVKTAKAAARDATAALEAAQAERDAAQGEVRALRLDAPVEALLDEVAVDAELFRGLFGRHYKFDLDDDGAVVILDTEGKPAMLTEPDRVTHKPGPRGKAQEVEATPGDTRPAAFTAGDVRRLAETCPDADRLAHVLLASRASGGGAAGSRGGGGPSPAPEARKPATASRPAPFGLR